MNLQEAIEILQDHDFQGADPEVLLALSTVIQATQTDNVEPDSGDLSDPTTVMNRQFDTSSD